MSLFKSKKNIDQNNIPTHIAFIMDGNGRWALRRGMPRTYGHREGANAMMRVVESCLDYGVKELSFFTFSTENWKRPQGEIDYIFELASEFSEKLTEQKYHKDIKLITSGDISALPSTTQKVIEDVKERTKFGNKMVVNLAINYGGRDEIINAINHILRDKLEHVDKQIFNSYLYTSELSDPDLVVRSSGEKRLSNFMLYQMAYSEIYFVKKHWPDFDKNTVKDCILEYQKRNRRFGAVK